VLLLLVLQIKKSRFEREICLIILRKKVSIYFSEEEEERTRKRFGGDKQNKH